MEENKQPLLSICIPTWNRWYSLQYTLKSIMDQEEFKSGDVEIVISDNASTDETEVEVKKLCDKYKNIRYFRNKENIGGCPNMINVLSLGKGRYLWLLGSDDSLYKESLNIILKAIKYNPKLILSRRYSINKDDNAENVVGEALGFRNFLNILIAENNKQDNNLFFTFMSIRCFNRDYIHSAYKKLINSFDKNILDNHAFNFSFIGFSNLGKDDGIIIIKEPKLVQVAPNVGWEPKMKIGKDLRQEMKFFIKKYSLNHSQKKILINIYRPWLIMCILYPIKKLLSNIGLEKLYDKASYLYRKVRGYI